MKWRGEILAATLMISQSAPASRSECAALLNGNSTAAQVPTDRLDGTEGFIAYLGLLLEQRQIGEREIEVLIEGLESRNEILNPIPHDLVASGFLFTRSADQIHYEALQEYILHSRLDPRKIKAWARATVQEEARVQERRAETQSETQYAFQEMEFHRVEAGSFIMGGVQQSAPVTLTHPFEMMSTQVTQKMWVDEMNENPSEFQQGDGAVTLSKNGKSIRMQADHPVESVTWWSVVVFANRLSEKMKLKPAYDLSGIKDWEGRAELGTLKPRDELKAELKLKINAPKGDIYRAEGYRLPTDAEQEFVRTDRGRSRGKYFSGVNASNLRNYAWFNDSSGSGPASLTARSTQAVARLSPYLIDGKDFYDLHGNVWEMGHDRISKSFVLKGGDDPIRGGATGYRGLRGGSWACEAHSLRSSFLFELVTSRAHDVGFRLVRTVLEGGGK